MQVPGSEAMLEAMSGADKVLNKVMRVTGIGKKIMSGFGEPEVSTAVPAVSGSLVTGVGKRIMSGFGEPEVSMAVPPSSEACLNALQGMS